MELKLIVNVSTNVHLWIDLRQRLASVTQQVARTLAISQKCQGARCIVPDHLNC